MMTNNRRPRFFGENGKKKKNNLCLLCLGRNVFHLPRGRLIESVTSQLVFTPGLFRN